MHYQTDFQLGEKVQNYLIDKMVETPMVTHNSMDWEGRYRAVESAFTGIMQVLGLDLNDDSLKDTPKRVAKMYLQEIFYGLDYHNFPKCTAVMNKMNHDEMVIEKDVTVSSTCEHHFVTIDGFAKIAYIPKDHVLGLSKLNRIVDFFSKRPQIQERLTEQIYHALSLILQTEDIAVEISAVHHCVKSRGIKDTNSYTITRKLGGAFMRQATRNEFLNSK
jgi:GTP cyclohydrolase IA